MDHEVFLLLRIREEYEATGNNEAAVARGLARTGRVITTAALIMVAVFGSFALAESIVIKEIGIGQSWRLSDSQPPCACSASAA